MRCVVIALLVLSAGPLLLLGGSSAPTTAPSDLEQISRSVAGLFELPFSQQQEVRRDLESQPDLPQLLADLLTDANPVVRRTSLMLLRDDYGDWPIVASVQVQLAEELAKPGGGDGYVVAACCEILADWPRWDSIPVLLEAMRTDGQVAGHDLSAGASRPGRVAVWRQVDSSLRSISGEWPLPEPDTGPAPAARAGSPRDRDQQQELERTWGQWWTASALSPDPLPQLRIELEWCSTADEADGPARREAAIASLWIRPTGSARFSRVTGMAPAPSDPAWRWTDRCRREYEWHLNAIQADAVRALVAALPAASPAQPWGIVRPVGVPDNWRGRIVATTPDGRVLSANLVDLASPESVRPPVPAAEALAELFALTVIP